MQRAIPRLWLESLWVVTKRELGGYFATPVAYVFIVIFLATAGAFTLIRPRSVGSSLSVTVPRYLPKYRPRTHSSS